MPFFAQRGCVTRPSSRLWVLFSHGAQGHHLLLHWTLSNLGTAATLKDLLLLSKRVFCQKRTEWAQDLTDFERQSNCTLMWVHRFTPSLGKYEFCIYWCNVEHCDSAPCGHESKVLSRHNYNTVERHIYTLYIYMQSVIKVRQCLGENVKYTTGRPSVEWKDINLEYNIPFGMIRPIKNDYIESIFSASL